MKLAFPGGAALAILVALAAQAQTPDTPAAAAPGCAPATTSPKSSSKR